MKHNTEGFNEQDVLHNLKHYLPAQAPLKDFIHHNTLHAFQNQNFNVGINQASAMFGYKTKLSLPEYRNLFNEGKIDKVVLTRVIERKKGLPAAKLWLDKVLQNEYPLEKSARIGELRNNWKSIYHLNLDSLVHPLLFRVICSYLDQGVAIWNFPVHDKGFLTALRDLEKNSFTSFFRTKRAKDLLLENKCGIASLLEILVGDSALYQRYIFDQQFAHQGWSGIVSSIEDNPSSLLDTKHITLRDLIVFELLLEIDVLEYKFGNIWSPLASKLAAYPEDLFAFAPFSELDEVLNIWQEAFEWTYYDQVLTGVLASGKEHKTPEKQSFQAMFCIDDRECSIRRHLEAVDPNCETFGTPGFFGVEFYYKPENGKFLTKLCPAPVNPAFLIKEVDTKDVQKKDLHLSKNTHSLIQGWLTSQTLGFLSPFRLIGNIISPSIMPAASSSFKHMHKHSKLIIENSGNHHKENNLQVGFTIPEMATRVENLLKSIGLVTNFAPIVYVIGHGSSSVNNPHYSAYDCGACSGRAGSVNARVICFMANHKEVRTLLKEKGIVIPETTQFVGGIHDTTCDDVLFFDEDSLNKENAAAHLIDIKAFEAALDLNAKERSRRFESINTKGKLATIHKKIRERSVSLFEPRPELNHATNTLCIVGSRGLSDHLFLDRRAFMNSYDYKIDPEGNYLFGILNAVAPVCGGINLEYYFSRVDNQKLGAGTKLPHNVMGLFGVANGADGDLRPGLPSQMIEIHDPLRLLVIVEHYPEVVLTTIQKKVETYEWFLNEWIHLVVVNPDTKKLYRLKEDKFEEYVPSSIVLNKVASIAPIIEVEQNNIPVFILSK